MARLNRIGGLCALLLVTQFAIADDAAIAKALRSLAEVHRIANVIEVRHATFIKLPLDLPTDPWGNAFRAEETDHGYRVVAAGADGHFDESSWTKAGQFEGIDGDVVFEDGKLVRSNRNWLARQVNATAESGRALGELREAELLFMAARVPIMQDVMASRVTTSAMRELGAKVEEHARTHDGSVATFVFPSVHDGWGTDFLWRLEDDTYRIVSAGSDKKFDVMRWERPPTISTTEDLVFRNGRLVRAHDERAILASSDLTVTPIAQPVDREPTDTRFARVAEDVTPPKVLTRVEPAYPEGYRRARITGIVIVQAAISENGATDNIRLLKSLAPDLDQSAMDAVRTWTFAPATRDGKPIAVLFNLTVNFKLK